MTLRSLTYTHQLLLDSSNYFHFEARGDMAGAAAETNSFKVILRAAQNESGTDDGYAADNLFKSVSSISNIVVGDFLAFDTTGTIVVAEIEALIGTKALGLASTISGSSKSWIAGEKVEDSTTGTFTAGTFSETLSTGVLATHNGNVVIKFNGDATLVTGALDGSGTLTSGSLNGAKTLEFIIIEEDTGSGDGSDGTDTFAAATLSTGTVSGNYIHIAGSYSLSSSAVADNMITVNGITDKQGVSWVSVPAGAGHTSTSIGSAAYSATNKTVTITLERDSGTLPSIAQIQSALTADDDLEFSSTVTALVQVAGVTGSGDLDEDLVTELSGTLGQRTYPFEGGADANQVVLDGNLTNGNSVQVYIGYRALRVDLSAAAADPSLTTINSIADITAKIGRSDTKDNPLGLAAKLALTNTVGNTSIKVLGLSAASSAELTSSPDGSVSAYTEALTMLESEDVYSLAPLSSAREVATLFSNHATTMSAAANKAERIAFVSRPFPAYSQAKLVASGSNGSTSSTFNSVSSGAFTASVDFGAGGANFSALEAALDAGDDVILVLNSYKTSTYANTELLGAASEQYGFRVAAVNSSNSFKLDINTADVAGTTTNDLSAQSWYLYVQGKAITETADQASRVASYGAEYGNRRAFLVWPPRVVATVGSNSEFLDGHYLAATIASMVGFQSVGKGFTNLTVSGFTGLRYSNRHFSKAQLDEIAGGGTMIVVQDVESGPFKIRHQLATDVSTVQKRELSITKQVDYFAKTLRDSLADRIGGSNITSEFIQGLGMNVQAIVASMVQRGIITSANLTSIVQDSTNPDTINIVIQVSPLYPCNYIEITLQL